MTDLQKENRIWCYGLQWINQRKMVAISDTEDGQRWVIRR